MSRYTECHENTNANDDEETSQPASTVRAPTSPSSVVRENTPGEPRKRRRAVTTATRRGSTGAA